MSNPKFDQAIDAIGRDMEDAQDWARMALACADQAGIDLKTQAKIRELLGIKSNCPYCANERAWVGHDGKLRHAGGVMCQEPIEGMNDQEIQTICFDRGWTVDFGDRTDGPFIPDGTVRIYDGEEFTDILGEGKTLIEAVAGLEGFDQ